MDAVLSAFAVRQNRHFCNLAAGSGGGSNKNNRQRRIFPFLAVKTVFLQPGVCSKNRCSLCSIQCRSPSDTDEKFCSERSGGCSCLHTGCNGRILGDSVKDRIFCIPGSQRLRYFLQCTALFCGMLSGDDRAFSSQILQYIPVLFKAVFSGI